MCNIDKIEKEIDSEMDRTIEEYLTTNTQVDPIESQYDMASDIEMEDYRSNQKAAERFLGEI